MPEEYINTFLNDIEKDAIIAFNENKTMAEAVRKVLLASIYVNGTLRPGVPANASRNFAFFLAASDKAISDEKLGEDLRGRLYGVSIVETGFVELAKLKRDTSDKKPKRNQAR